MAKIQVQVDDNFKQLYDIVTGDIKGINLVVCIGGRGGKKTYEVSKFSAWAATTRKKRIAITRDEKETIRESILNEIFQRYDTANKYGHFDSMFDKIDTGIRDKISGNMVIYTKGFRASSNEKKTNMKGVSDTDIAIVEEAEDIRDFNKFSVFKDSIRTKDRLIIIILNTPDIQHWIIERYFNLELVEDGYWMLRPKKIEGFLCIQTSYKDNKYLPPDVVRDYENYGNPKSEMYDPHYHKTAILGYASSGRKGQILTNVKPITLEEFRQIDARVIYGQDFGTARPAGFIAVKLVGNNLYAHELNYKPKDEILIAQMYCQMELDTDEDLIIGDSAEPLTIGKLRRGWKVEELSGDVAKIYPNMLIGWNIRNSIKGPGSISAGLTKLKSMNIYLTEESKNGWKEVNNYIWATDKNGNYTGDPIDDFNHLIDPMRYVVQARGRLF